MAKHHTLWSPSANLHAWRRDSPCSVAPVQRDRRDTMAQQQTLYQQWFVLADEDRDGAIAGAEAVKFFSRSGLDQMTLGQVRAQGAVHMLPIMGCRAARWQRERGGTWRAGARTSILIAPCCAGLGAGLWRRAQAQHRAVLSRAEAGGAGAGEARRVVRRAPSARF